MAQAILKIDIARKPITFTRCDERWEVFAPSWELLADYKGGGITWAEYERRYTDEMRTTYRANPRPFYEMARRLDGVELICWCTKKRGVKQCHRFLLRAILEKVRSRLTGSSSTSTGASGKA